MDEFIKKIKRVKDKEYFRNPLIPEEKYSGWDEKLPGVVALDADGTILKMKGGDHWFTLINKISPESQKRIQERVRLLGKSFDKFEQQYLSAASLYEFALNDWTTSEMKDYAKEVRLREGVIELLHLLQDKGYKIVIISHGIKLVLSSLLEYHGFTNIEVFANETYSKKEIAPLLKDFIPEWGVIASEKDTPEAFLKYAKSMDVVPATKGIILHNIFNKYSNNKKNIAIGDSEGDLELFRTCLEFDGHSILHAHMDKPNKNVMDSSDIERFFEVVSYFSVNNVDSSFSKTDELVRRLI